MFHLNELVLCYRDDELQEAKVLKVGPLSNPSSPTASWSPGLQYLVHYKGSRQQWDEWVPEQRLLKHTRHNHLKGGGLAASRKGRGTKRVREDEICGSEPEMKLIVPSALKTILVDDWESVTRNKKLIPLPRNPTARGVLNEFSLHLKSSSPTHLKEPMLLAETVVDGIRVYFDRGLGSILLYAFEREQYLAVRDRYWAGQDVIIGAEKEMSDIYGAEHLLRLLVELPTIVSKMEMDAVSIQVLADYINELLSYMVQQKARFFHADYENAPPTYRGVAASYPLSPR